MKITILIIFAAIIALAAISCSKKNDLKATNISDNNLTNLPQNDTVNFKFLDTDKLINCMLINDVRLKKDSFLIKSEAELFRNFTADFCKNSLPKVNLQDSMIIGYTTKIGGSGYRNDGRMLTYDRSTNALTYSFTVFTNDTSMLTTELNWIALPKYEIDSVNFKVNIIKK